MLHRFISTIIFAFTCMVAGAQGVCTINGNIQDCSLNNGEKIKKVFLTRTNESGQAVEVATAKVKKGKYTFKYNLAQGEPVLLYNITGFGEGKNIEVFVEPGEVVIETESAACPENSIATGTPANDTYAQYKVILSERAKEVADAVTLLERERGKEWLESPDGKREVKRIEAGIVPRPKGRPQKDGAPRDVVAEQVYEINRLKMENQLLRDFLRLTGRK